MFIRVMVFYTVAGSIIWAMTQALGLGFGVAFFASMMGPPIAHIAFIIYKNG